MFSFEEINTGSSGISGPLSLVKPVSEPADFYLPCHLLQKAAKKAHKESKKSGNLGAITEYGKYGIIAESE